MSTISENLGVAHEFKHRGYTYQVSLINQNIKAAFEKKLFGKAKDVAATMRDLMDRQDYLVHLKELNDDYISGAYTLESTRGLAALKTVPGFMMLTSLLFNCDETEMLQIISERSAEVQALMELILRESFPAIEQVAAKDAAKDKETKDTETDQAKKK